MRADGVVDRDGVADRGACVSERGEARIEIEFVFQHAVDAFGHRVLVAMRPVGHAREHPQGLQLPEVLVTAVLTATIGVMDDPRAVPERLLGGSEGRERAVMREIPPQVPADDAPRGQIGDEKQVGKRAVREAEVRDVTDHHLARGGDGHRLHEIRGDDVVVPRIRGLRGAPFPGHQASRGAQQCEQLVPPHGHPRGREGVVQLPRSDARLDAAEGIDGVQHYGVRRVGVTGPPLAFVEGVARAAERAADAGDGVRGVGRLAEDGSGGVPKFFLMSIL